MYRLLFVCTSLLILSSCSKSSSPSSPGGGGSSQTTLTAYNMSSGDVAPDVNSSTVESVWNNATPLTVTATDIGQNFKATSLSFPVSIKSVVKAPYIYFLVQYNDETADYLRTPISFKGGDPSAKSNWIELPQYDDGVSFIFEKVPGTGNGGLSFKSNGCAMLCHSESIGILPVGMYSEDTGLYDMWYWHAGKSNGCGYADDDALVGDPQYSILKDDENAENYENNIIDSLPFNEAGGTNMNLDATKFIAKETAQPFDPTGLNPATKAAWAVGDRVPGYTISQVSAIQAQDSYFDVQSRGYWSNGQWTVKFKRNFVASDVEPGGLDLEFKSGHQYLFSFAIHNATEPDNHYGVANQSFVLSIP